MTEEPLDTSKKWKVIDSICECGHSRDDHDHSISGLTACYHVETDWGSIQQETERCGCKEFKLKQHIIEEVP